MGSHLILFHGATPGAAQGVTHMALLSGIISGDTQGSHRRCWGSSPSLLHCMQSKCPPNVLSQAHMWFLVLLRQNWVTQSQTLAGTVASVSAGGEGPTSSASLRVLRHPSSVHFCALTKPNLD